MSDVQSSLPPASGLQMAAPEPIRLPDEPVLHNTPRESVIVIKRATIYYSVVGVMIFVGAYLIGFTMGTASTAGTVQAVREAIATGIAGLPANNAGNVAVVQPQQPPTEDPTLRYTVEVTGSPALGPENAPITVVEFSDFQCPFCGRFFGETEASLLKKYAGKIRFVYRNFPLEQIHPYALGAAEAAQCANDQNKFWEYHDLLFQNQQQLTKDDLLAYARQLKLDMTSFQACLDGNKDDAKIQNDLQAAAALNLSGTPTFFINGRKLVGAQPLIAFTAYIDAELAHPLPLATATGNPSR